MLPDRLKPPAHAWIPVDWGYYLPRRYTPEEWARQVFTPGLATHLKAGG